MLLLLTSVVEGHAPLVIEKWKENTLIRIISLL